MYQVAGSCSDYNSSLGSLYILYCTLIRWKLEYTSVVWNSAMTTDANKLEHIQHKFSALYYNHFLPQVHYTYCNALEYLNLHDTTWNHLDALFLIQVYLDSKFCPSVLENVGLRVPTRHLKRLPYLFPLNIFYYKQDTYLLYAIYLLNSIVYIIFFYYYYSYCYFNVNVLCFYLLEFVFWEVVISTFSLLLFFLCCICNWPFDCWYSIELNSNSW
jgi:hypothetical protein